MEKTLEEIKSIVELIPGATVVYRCTDGEIKRIHCSKSLPDMLGYTLEEYEQLNPCKPLAQVYPSDVEGVSAILKKKISLCEDIDISYRMICKSGGLIWVRTHGKYIGEMEKSPLYLASIFDVNDEREAQNSMLEVSDRGVAVFDRDTKEILYGNSTFFQYAGTTKEESMGRSCYEVICKMKEWTLKDCFCFQTVDLGKEVETYNPVSGRYFTMLAKSAIWSEHSAIVFYMSDITESKKKDMELAAKNEQLRKVQEESIRAYRRQLEAVMRISRDALGTCRMNLSKNICYNGNSKYKNLGRLVEARTVDEYCEMALKFMTAEEIEEVAFRPNCQGMVDAYQNGQTILSADCHYLIAEEDRRYVRTTISMAENPLSGDLEAVLYIEDITQRELNSHILKQLMDQHYEGVVLMDVVKSKTTIYQYTYDMNVDLQNYTMDTQETLNRFAEKYVIPEERESYKVKSSQETVVRELECNPSYSFVFHFQKDDEPVRLKTVSFYKLFDDGNLVMGLTEDITEITRQQREHMEALKAEKMKADRATESKSAFFASISHDMRTPLNGILGFTQLALEAPTMEENHDCLKKIQSSGDFLLKLINDTLDISKIENGSMRLTEEVFPVYQASRTCIDAIEEQARKKGIKLVVQMPEDDGRCVRTDKLRLQQMFTNLLGNAVKFTPKGGEVDFIVRRTDCEKYGTNHIITIKDNGIGMKKEFIPHAFEAFSQQEGTPTQKNMGTGLGLAIVKQLVDLMRGHIELSSEEGKGTQYDIYLPLEYVYDKAEVHEETAEETATDLTGRKILLCEDHPINRELAERLLKNKGMEVTGAENGRVGSQIFADSKEGFFDAILMDIRMPEMDGLEAAKLIRSMNRGDAKTIPVIAMTANAFATDKEESLNAGMNAHISKPINPAVLYRTLREVMKQK